MIGAVSSILAQPCTAHPATVAGCPGAGHEFSMHTGTRGEAGRRPRSNGGAPWERHTPNSEPNASGIHPCDRGGGRRRRRRCALPKGPHPTGPARQRNRPNQKKVKVLLQSDETHASLTPSRAGRWIKGVEQNAPRCRLEVWFECKNTSPNGFCLSCNDPSTPLRSTFQA